MKGRSWVRVSISRARSLPTRRFAATWPRSWGSHPPRAASMLTVRSSRVARSRPPRATWSPKQLPDRSRWTCCSSEGAFAYIAATASSPTTCSWTLRPASRRVSGVVVACPGSGSGMPRATSTSFMACRKSNTRAIPTYGTAWYTTSLASTGGTPTVSAAPSMTRNSPTAPSATMAASCARRRVRSSSWLPRSTSSKARLSKDSISSGSETARVDTCPGNRRS